MSISLTRRGLFCIFRFADSVHDAVGFVIKPVIAMVFSERHDKYKMAFRLGPLYFRTYAKRGRELERGGK